MTAAAARDTLGKVSWLTAAFTLVGAATAARWGRAASAGVVAGGALSLLNWLWLRAGADALVRTAAGGPVDAPARRGMMRFWLRYALLAVALYGIFISHLVPLEAVVAGLFAVPAATLSAAVAELFGGRYGASGS